MDVPRNANARHRAVIWIQAEVHEVLPSGECSGMPTVKIKRFPLYLDGNDKYITERRLNELLEEVKTKCQQNQ